MKWADGLPSPQGGLTSARRLYPVCTIFLVGAHSVRPRNAISNGFRPFLAQTPVALRPFLVQAPVALRANNVRPYDYTFADGLHGGVNERRKSGHEKKDVPF